MAEFCLDCWNKMNHTLLAKEDVILSEEPDLCEGCAELKPTVVRYSTRKEKSKARRRDKRRGCASP
jgi:hypothetical protein